MPPAITLLQRLIVAGLVASTLANATPGISLTMAMCSVQHQGGWGVHDIMNAYLAMLYWKSGPSSLAGGVPRSGNSANLTINVVNLDSGCSSTTSFSESLRVFSPTNERIDVISGCICSSASLQVGRFSTALHIPMMLTASQDVSLSNKNDYPYAFRWCTTAITDADMHASVMTALEIQKYSLLYVDMSKNVLAKDSLLANPALKGVDVNAVRLEDTDLSDAENYASAINSMQSVRASSAWIIVSYMSSALGTNNQALGLEATMEAGLLNNYSITLQEESAIVFLDATRYPLLRAPMLVGYVGSFMGRAKTVKARHEAYKEWITTVDVESLYELGFDPDGYFQPAWITNAKQISHQWHAFRFDSTIAILMVMEELALSGKPVTSDAIYNGILNLPLKGLMGDVSWDEKLNRQGLVYEVLQLQWTGDDLPWPPLLAEVGEVVLTPDEEGIVRASLDQSAMLYQTSGHATLPRRELVHPEAPACERGWTKPDEFSHPSECVPCAVGEYAPEGTSNRCSACQPGFYGDDIAALRCQPCVPGSFTNASHATACLSCEAGSAVAEPGATACVACQQGKFADVTGASGCDFCPEGTFQPLQGKSHCEDCIAYVPGSGTLRRIGSTSAFACTCDEGYYLHRAAPDAEPTCASCPEGVLCFGGNSSLVQEEGYHVGLQAYPGALPSPRVLCAVDRKCPPGRLLGVCPDHRQGRGCDECEDRYRSSSSASECKKCDDGLNWLPGIAFVLGCIVIISCLTVSAILEQRVQRRSILTGLICLSLALNAAQTLSVVSRLSLEWNDPMKSLREVLQLLVLDTEILQMDCLFGTSAPTSIYLANLSMLPFVTVMQLLSFVLIWCLYKKCKIDRNRVTNSVGALILVAYLSIASVCLMPWQCRSNPDGTSSVLTFRSILCFESDNHTSMLAASMLATLVYVVGFFALIVWVTFVYPKQVAGAGGAHFIRQYQFLFNRFTPSRYYYGLFFVVRNFLIASVPVTQVNESASQVLCLTLLISASGAVENILRPWKVMLANWVSASFTVGMLVVLCAGAILIETSTNNSSEIIQGFVFGIIIVTFGIALCVAASFTWKAIFPQKPYGVFLCHHKHGAGVLARFFKLVLIERLSTRVFLDSDELDNLALLFDVVAYKTRNLMVLLTKETLARIWCAGEVTTALRHKIPVVPVAAGDYVAPSDDFIEQLPEIWRDSAKAELSSLGVPMKHVQQALVEFRSLEEVQLDRTSDFETQEQVVAISVSKCAQLPNLTLKAKTVRKAEDVEMIIIGDSSDAEASCICEVLRRLIMKTLQKSVAVIRDPEDARWSWKYLLSVLTRGVLEQPTFAFTMVVAHRSLADTTAVNADAGFPFPGEESWVKLRQGQALDLSQTLLQGVRAEEVVRAYKWLFRGIAKTFSPRGSERIQLAEVEDMARRWARSSRVASVSGARDTMRSSNCSTETNTTKEGTGSQWLGACPSSKIRSSGTSEQGTSDIIRVQTTEGTSSHQTTEPTKKPSIAQLEPRMSNDVLKRSPCPVVEWDL